MTPDADEHELIDTRFPPAEVVMVTRRRNPKLWWAVAGAFFAASIFMALVIAWSSYRAEHHRALRSDASVVQLQEQLDTANTSLSDARKQAERTAAEATCRAKLANTVSDAQAAAVVTIGDVAVAELGKDDLRAYAAVVKYQKASAAYKAAVKLRGDSVEACAHHR